YLVLGVAKDIDTDGVNRAYRRLALRLHPDRQHGADAATLAANEEKFKRITDARDILVDPRKRQIFDQFGAAGLDMMSGVASPLMDP
ncbi:Hsp40-like protein, subfamily B, member 5, partial [Ramicandelaber brevisporus]